MLLIISLLGSKKKGFVENEWERNRKNEIGNLQAGTFFVIYDFVYTKRLYNNVYSSPLCFG